MSTINTKEFLWCERFRPKTIADTILPDRLKNMFVEIAAKGQIHNMILSGGAGGGKTTLARALCNEIKADCILINASEDCGIDVLRTRIKQFASSVSLGGSGILKVVILDEADALGSAVQSALRGFIEEFSANCRFILTCNFKNRIIEPLHSRCPVIEFNITSEELASCGLQFFKRLKMILNEQGIKFDPKLLKELVLKYAPDWRRTINECQRFSTSGELKLAALSVASNEVIKELISYIKSKDFKLMRTWVTQHSDLDSTTVFRGIYDGLYEYVQPDSIPQAVLIIAEYSYKSAFVADKEINTVAALTEMMASINFK